MRTPQHHGIGLPFRKKGSEIVTLAGKEMLLHRPRQSIACIGAKLCPRIFFHGAETEPLKSFALNRGPRGKYKDPSPLFRSGKYGGFRPDDREGKRPAEFVGAHRRHRIAGNDGGFYAELAEKPEGIPGVLADRFGRQVAVRRAFVVPVIIDGQAAADIKTGLKYGQPSYAAVEKTDAPAGNIHIILPKQKIFRKFADFRKKHLKNSLQARLFMLK